MRSFLNELDKTGDLTHVTREVSTNHEVAAVAHKLEGRPILFEKNKESREYRVAVGVCATRSLLARSLNVKEDRLLERILESIEKPGSFQTVDRAPCQEVVEDAVDLHKIPILTHFEQDGGPYATASIIVVKDKELGYNASYHRLMLIGKDRVAVRILPRRLDEFIKRATATSASRWAITLLSCLRRR